MLPTPVFWPEEFCGLYSTWGRKELDTTEQHSLLMKSLQGKIPQGEGLAGNMVGAGAWLAGVPHLCIPQSSGE